MNTYDSDYLLTNKDIPKHFLSIYDLRLFTFELGSFQNVVVGIVYIEFTLIKINSTLGFSLAYKTTH